MILELIAIFIFIISLIGLVVIILKKIPVLIQLVPQEAQPKHDSGLKKGTLNSKELFLHKILSKVRILTLKTDNKTTEWMKKLREKSQEDKIKFSENYWDKLRK